MNFQSLKDYLERMGCTIDHYRDKQHIGSNPITGKSCIIEDQPIYTQIALIHYFHTLGVSPPKYLRKKYYDLIEDIKNSLQL